MTTISPPIPTTNPGTLLDIKDATILSKIVALIYHRVPLIIYRWDPHLSRIHSMNPFGLEFHGLTPQKLEAMAGPDLGNLIHADDRAEIEAIRQAWVARPFPGGVSPIYEHRRRRADGTMVWFQARDFAYPAGQEGESVLLTICQDISTSKATEHALAMTERRLRMILESMRDCIWSCDLQMRFDYMTPSIERLLGYTAQEVLALGPTRTLTPHALSVVREALASELAREVAAPGTAGFRRLYLDQIHKDGHIVPTEVLTMFLRNEEGQVTGVAGVTRDISPEGIDEVSRQAALEAFRQRHGLPPLTRPGAADPTAGSTPPVPAAGGSATTPAADGAKDRAAGPSLADRLDDLLRLCRATRAGKLSKADLQAGLADLEARLLALREQMDR